MPYINSADRATLTKPLVELVDEINFTVASGSNIHGTLNYAITELINLAARPVTYGDYNNLIGVLECVKLELYRRAVAPYEDLKMFQNGDIPAYAPKGS
jgi:hypothetical protein